MKEFQQFISYGVKQVRYQTDDVYENDRLIDSTSQRISDHGEPVPVPESKWVPYCNWCDPDIVWDDGLRTMNLSEMCPKCREDPSWCEDRVRNTSGYGEDRFIIKILPWDREDRNWYVISDCGMYNSS